VCVNKLAMVTLDSSGQS